MQIGLSLSCWTSVIALASRSASSVSGHAHVDVEHVRAPSTWARHVALDGGQVAGAQLVLEDPAAGRVDPLADQAEPGVVTDDDLLGGRAEDRLEARGRGAHAGTFARFSCSRALARLTVCEASAA